MIHDCGDSVSQMDGVWCRYLESPGDKFQKFFMISRFNSSPPTVIGWIAVKWMIPTSDILNIFEVLWLLN